MRRRTARPNQTPRPAISVLALAAFAIGAAGCSARHADYHAFLHQPRPLVTASEYRMSPPDEILISSKRIREINQHAEIIRPDGKITLPLLGSVFVAGQTCEQASRTLEDLARAYYDDADVTVRVTSFKSKKIFVFGEVSRAGAYPYDGANTVLETLAFAQPTRLADPSRIDIVRPAPEEEGGVPRRMTIDLNDMVKRGDTTLDAVLEEGDIIYVPPNPLASVGLALQQLLLPIQPAASTVAGPADISRDFQTTPYR